MKIVLTHGYFLLEDPKEKLIMRPYPPLGILYVSAYLDQHGYNHEVFDTTFSSQEKLKTYLLEEKPEVVAFYVNLMTKLNVLNLIQFIREHRELDHTKVILGGPDVRYNAENLLRNGASFLVIGEGEESFLELVQNIEKGPEADYASIDGIAYIDDKDVFQQNGERTKIREINELPVPNRDKINLHLYLDAWKSHHGQSALSVSTMRGCPYTCKWCSRAVYGLSYRRRKPKNVVDELEDIQRKYNPDTIWFVDDVFTVNYRWLEQFRDELKARDVKISYECITRADKMNERVVNLLQESGCFRVWIGAESGSQKVIDLMDRRVSVHKVREMIRLSRKKGIQAGTFIMLGYPGETEEDIEETIHHLKTSNPDQFTITVAYPIRGTELFQEVEGLQVADLPWETSTDRDIDFQRTYPRPYYDYAVRRVTNEVNFHKQRLARRALSWQAFNYKARSTAAKIGMWYYRNRSQSPKEFEHHPS